jgi:glycine cleavage system H protein
MIVRFTRDHEWIRVEGEIGAVGISDYAQKQLGDVVFVELPEIGARIGQGDQAGVVESVKAASEVYSPVSGEIVAINETLAEHPARVNEHAMGDGWFFKIRLDDPAELDSLLDPKAYQDYLETLD